MENSLPHFVFSFRTRFERNTRNHLSPSALFWVFLDNFCFNIKSIIQAVETQFIGSPNCLVTLVSSTSFSTDLLEYTNIKNGLIQLIQVKMCWIIPPLNTERDATSSFVFSFLKHVYWKLWSAAVKCNCRYLSSHPVVEETCTEHEHTTDTQN